MIKVLHLCNYTWETGGPPSVIYAHAEVQREYQIEQHVYSTPKSFQNLYPLRSNQRLFVFKYSFLSKILADFSWSLIWFFIQNRNQYQYINSHGLWNLGSILPFLIPNKAKKIITLHGFLDDYVLTKSAISKRIFWFLIQKYCLIKSDVIQIISKNEQEFVETNFPYLANKCVYVPNGLSIPHIFDEVDLTFKENIDSLLRSNDIVLLYLGRINKKKGLDLLVPAFNKLIGLTSLKIKLLLVGPDDGYLNELQSIVSSNPSNYNFIEFLKPVKGAEKDYLLNNCHVFVLPSYSEGFSIAALEAIAYGIPGIFSDVVGFSEDIKAYKAGLICKLDVESLTEQMYKLITNEDLRKSISINGKKLFAEKYSIDKVAENYINNILSIK